MPRPTIDSRSSVEYNVARTETASPRGWRRRRSKCGSTSDLVLWQAYPLVKADPARTEPMLLNIGTIAGRQGSPAGAMI